MFRQRAFIVELIVAAALIVAPYVLPHLGFTPTTMTLVIAGATDTGATVTLDFTGM